VKNESRILQKFLKSQPGANAMKHLQACFTKFSKTSRF